MHQESYRLMELQILLLSLTVASAVSLNCTPQTYVCDGEEVVCNCTAPCSEVIHWWDNNTIPFCSRTQLCNGNRENCVPDISGSPPVRVEVINCLSTDIFTSRLSYNASLEIGSNSKIIQIGCSSAVNDSTCSPEGDASDAESVMLLVINCTGLTAPGPPRNLQLSMMESTQCNSPRRNISITWQAPESEPSQLPVTHYKLSCTPSEGDSCSETLPADMTSFSDLPVVAGNLYTITVSALSNDRESQNNPHLNIAIVEVLNVTVAENNATIQLRNDNFTSNFTISYGLCSEDSRTPKSFESPVVHLENLTANTAYCYSITSNGNDLVATTCSGTFTTATETTPTTQPTTKPDIPLIVGLSVGLTLGVLLAFVITVGIVALIRWWRRRHAGGGAGNPAGGGAGNPPGGGAGNPPGGGAGDMPMVGQ